MPASSENLLKVATGFWAPRTLLSAVELGLFTELARRPGDVADIRKRLGLHPRAARDFLDALTALGFLKRENGTYHNTPETEQFLNEDNSPYLGEFLRLMGEHIYPSWGGLTESLRTGRRQSLENSDGEEDFYADLYSDQKRLKIFLGAMTALSGESSKIIAEKLPWSNYKSCVDVGAAEGGLLVEIIKQHSHLSGIGFELPVVRPVFEDYVKTHFPEGKIQFCGGDFFKQPLPKADVVLMAHILHNWDPEQKRHLLRSAYGALPQGGMLVVYDTIIDDARSRNAFGLLMSLNMLVMTHGGFDYTAADCRRWMEEVGFGDIRQEPLAGPDSMMIGFRE